MAMKARTVYEETVAKQDVFRFQVDDEDRARLARLAAHYNLTPSAVVRMLIKRDDDAVNATRQTSASTSESAPKPRKKKP
jgi:antitoxin component of RelBE/YafQ-DinJ toxin-antitoxin module